jgi:hypothetical protein
MNGLQPLKLRRAIWLRSNRQRLKPFERDQLSARLEAVPYKDVLRTFPSQGLHAKVFAGIWAEKKRSSFGLAAAASRGVSLKWFV